MTDCSRTGVPPDPVPITVGAFGGGCATELLALNNLHEVELSRLELGRFISLVEQAFRASRIGTDGFLLAFDQAADYDSVNFRWFRARYARFVYVDRVVVSEQARGRGYAKRLYHDLFAAAVAAGHHMVACEINAAPPNPASDAFHAALRFRDVGVASIHAGRKTVRYCIRDLTGCHPGVA
jgi:uncharacterized protein